MSNARLRHYYETLGFIRITTKPMSANYIASLYERVVR